jgi:hypothetical protein
MKGGVFSGGFAENKDCKAVPRPDGMLRCAFPEYYLSGIRGKNT